MNDGVSAGWYTDPTGRSDHRYWDGSDWTDHVARGGEQALDPVDGGAGDPTRPVMARPPESPGSDEGVSATVEQPAQTAAIEPSVMPVTVPAPTAGRRWVWPVVAVVALFAGVGIGTAAGTDQSKINDVNRRLASTSRELRTVRQERDAALRRVNDRISKQRAEEAATAAAKAKQEAADRKKVDDALAEQKRLADEAAAQQAQAAAAEALRNTIDSDGVYAIGTDKNPGRYKTTGSPTGCYWQISPDPNGSDILENDFGDGVAYAQVSSGQFFQTKGCGSWERVG